MGLHTGPKDGDYARYVEFLTSGTGGEPGKVYTSKSAKPANWSLESESPPLPDGFIADPAAMKPNPLVPSGRSAHQPTMAASSDQVSPGATYRMPAAEKQPRTTTLAEQGRRRALSMIFMIIAFFVGLSGVSNLIFVAAVAPVQDVEAYIPGVFMLVFAWMLSRGARGLRRDAERPTPALPPLTTLSTRQSAKK